MDLSDKQLQVMRCISRSGHFNYQSFSKEERRACDYLQSIGFVWWHEEDLGGPCKVPTMVRLSEAGTAALEQRERAEKKDHEDSARDDRNTAIAIIAVIVTIVVGLLSNLR